jgi:hypothetical protein
LYEMKDRMYGCDTKVHFVCEIERLLMDHFSNSEDLSVTEIEKLETYRELIQECGNQQYGAEPNSRFAVSSNTDHHELLVQLLSVQKQGRNQSKSAGRKRDTFDELVKNLNERNLMARLSNQRRPEDMLEWKRRFQLATEEWENGVMHE